MTDIRNDRPMQLAATGGSTVEAILGAGAVILAVLGLLNLLPVLMMEIAAIALGVALLLEGAALTAHFMQARTQLGQQTRNLIGGGVSAEFIGGAAAIVLGVLSIIGVGAATTLIPVAAIVLGASLLLGGGVTPDTPRYSSQYLDDRQRDLERGTFRRDDTAVGSQVAMGAGGTASLIGAGAVVLGILALLEINPVTLTLIAMLVVGTGVVLSGSALALRLGRLAGR